MEYLFLSRSIEYAKSKIKKKAALKSATTLDKFMLQGDTAYKNAAINDTLVFLVSSFVIKNKSNNDPNEKITDGILEANGVKSKR